MAMSMMIKRVAMTMAMSTAMKISHAIEIDMTMAITTAMAREAHG